MVHQPSWRHRLASASRCIDIAISGLCKLIIGSTIVVLLVGLACNVAVRYFLHGGSIDWVAELPALLFPWMIAAGIVLAVQNGGHINIDLAGHHLGARGRSALTALVHLLLVAAYVVLFKVIVEMMHIVAIERSPMLATPLSWPYAAIAFAACSTALCSLLIALRAVLEGGSGLAAPTAREEIAP
ncbi:TRAP transporter small permease [Lampropedia cohaerens]|uniref:TRAP transporter small permease n=1 Tax=Lampropedia cohaerens TaxID=1610491 RepID=UPI0018D1FDAC|nr:TRAP transporter small permease [Lampropedia cohaerens]